MGMRAARISAVMVVFVVIRRDFANYCCNLHLGMVCCIGGWWGVAKEKLGIKTEDDVGCYRAVRSSLDLRSKIVQSVQVIQDDVQIALCNEFRLVLDRDRSKRMISLKTRTRTINIKSVYEACMRAVGLVSSYPVKFSASTMVIIPSSFRSPSVSRSSSRIWKARVAGNAEPLQKSTPVWL